MPLKLHFEDRDSTEWAIWETTEPEGFFMQDMPLFPEEKEEIDGLNERKRYEWLASRHLLHHMSGRDMRGACLKDEFGKPYLKDSSHHISLSHSRDMVAVMASPSSCGIDIQYRVDKIYRIADKFINEPEKAMISKLSDPITSLHIIWGAKESLYKAYGRKKLDFRTNMHIQPFDPHQTAGHTTGVISTEHFRAQYDIHFRILTDLVLVYAIQHD